MVAVNPRDKTITSASAGYTLLANVSFGGAGDTTRTVAYGRTFASPTTDTFQATLSGKKGWVTAGIVLNHVIQTCIP